MAPGAKPLPVSEFAKKAQDGKKDGLAEARNKQEDDAYRLGLKPYWLGKREIFRWPFGGVMRWLGGVPVDRKARTNLVQQVIDRFEAERGQISRL